MSKIKPGDICTILGEGSDLWAVTTVEPDRVWSTRLVDGSPSGWESPSKITVLSLRVAKVRLTEMHASLVAAAARVVAALKVM